MVKDNIYLLGIGGIGMSALARYFLHQGRRVAGYDRTETPLTRSLEAEGAAIHYTEDREAIPAPFREAATTVVVYTPALPASHDQMRYFREGGFEMLKRSEMLGHLAEGKYVMAVAGTHGKTTTSTLAAWLNRCTTGEGSAFLGGISRNFGSNLVLGAGRRLAVEADEYDRSFLRLHPDVAVVTSADADHLDIYGTHRAVREAFSQFVRQIRAGGTLIIRQGVDIEIDNPNIALYRYDCEEPCDFHARNIAPIEGGYYRFDLVTPDGVIDACTLGVPGHINIENAIAAAAMLWAAARAEGAGLDAQALRSGLASFRGVKRRFEFHLNTPRQVYMDDYAHHPRELSAAIRSVRAMFPWREITAIFQPHLFTRTRDLCEEFAAALSLADRVVLLPVYPAREEPIPGVDSQLIARRIDRPCTVVEREALPDYLTRVPTDVVVSFGAGDIENSTGAIAEALRRKTGI